VARVRLPAASHLLDLTHPLSGDFPVIPIPGVTFPFRQTPIATLERNRVYANKWELTEHTGTHVDAPNHFAAGAPALDELPAGSLVAPLAVVDVRARAARDADYAVTVDDVRAWERRHGRLPRGAAVFADSGWDARATHPAAFLGRDAGGTLHFPGFAPETCAFLLAERDVVGVGIDTLSIDVGPAAAYPAHRVWFAGHRWAAECVAHLAQVPRAGATVWVGAPKVRGASGGPARLLAVW
jgi:kynurenine formamidase